MDLRDYFAAKAMEADITNWSPENAKAQPTQFWGYEKIADRAYQFSQIHLTREAAYKQWNRILTNEDSSVHDGISTA